MKTPNYDKFMKNRELITQIMNMFVYCTGKGFLLHDRKGSISGGKYVEIVYKFLKINPKKLEIERAYLEGDKK